MSSIDHPSLRCSVVIPAAGSGTRFGSETPKQFHLLGGRPVIAHTIARFVAVARVDRIVVAVSPEREQALRTIIKSEHWQNVDVVEGGDTRQESVLRGVAALPPDTSLVAVHDAVRPFFSTALIEALIEAASRHGAALPLVELTDTLHRIDGSFVIETPERSDYGLAQTPQCFAYPLLLDALRRATAEGITATDEVGVVRRLGHPVYVVRGEVENFKITHPDDFRRAEAIVARSYA